MITTSLCTSTTGILSDFHVILYDLGLATAAGIASAARMTPGKMRDEANEREIRRKRLDSERYFSELERRYRSEEEITERLLTAIGALILISLVVALIYLCAPVIYEIVASLPISVAIIAGAIIIGAAIALFAA